MKPFVGTIAFVEILHNKIFSVDYCCKQLLTYFLIFSISLLRGGCL